MHGTAVDRSGAPIPEADLRLTLGDDQRFPPIIARDISTPTGDYAFDIPSTPLTRQYARSHSGKLNVLLWAKTSERVHIRAMIVPLINRDGTFVSDFDAGRTALLLSQPYPPVSDDHDSPQQATAADVDSDSDTENGKGRLWVLVVVIGLAVAVVVGTRALSRRRTADGTSEGQQDVA